MSHLSDLEITRACAEAMGYVIDENTSASFSYTAIWVKRPDAPPGIYYPLVDDAQAMALVKNKYLSIDLGSDAWFVRAPYDALINENNRVAAHSDLNRAICECVAKLQQAKAATA